MHFKGSVHRLRRSRSFGTKAPAFETFINPRIRTFYRRYRYETCSKLNGGSKNVIENVQKWPEIGRERLKNSRNLENFEVKNFFLKIKKKIICNQIEGVSCQYMHIEHQFQCFEVVTDKRLIRYV